MNTFKAAATLSMFVLLANTLSLAATQSPSTASPHNKVNAASIQELTSKAHNPGQLVVRLDTSKRSKANESLRSILSQTRGGVRWESKLVPGLMVLDIQGSVSNGLQAARGRAEGVLYSHPSYLMQTDNSNDPKWDELWGLKNTGQDVESNGYWITGTPDIDIRAEEAWGMQPGADNVVVAVIDNGVDIEHDELLEIVWTNTGENPHNGVDDDNNGYIDDVHGWNFSDNQAGSIPMDHGTHTSGTIAAVGNNNTGIIGVAPGATIMPVQFIGESGGYLSEAIKAIEYAVLNGARISNNSWGGGGYDTGLHDVMEAAGRDHDHLFVISAGNDGGSCGYPAAYNLDCIISVAALRPDGQLASFSNHGNGVDLAAPGWGIMSSTAGNQYRALNGTSMAAPHVAGVAALLLARSNGNATAAEMKQAILSSVRPLDSLAYSTETGGMLDATAAITALDAGPSDPSNYGLLQHSGSKPHNMSTTFEPDGRGWNICTEQDVTALPLPSGGDDLNLQDDTSFWIELDWDFEYAGRSYRDVQVHSNGSVTFANAPWLFEGPSVENFSTAARIAPMYTDLDPSAGGSVRIVRRSDRIAFSWLAVPAYSMWGGQPQNTMQLELFQDGRIRMTWLDVPAFDSQSVIIGMGGDDISDRNVDFNSEDDCDHSDPPGTSCAEDVSGDGSVGMEDLMRILEAWGTCE
ncbi:MAG: S8 family serine peptidase [Planctomycetes bacterium]|jgi:subtilisin family serine protease|nr:S8 family serine peptidase [Planctomycetota bacterium]